MMPQKNPVSSVLKNWPSVIVVATMPFLFMGVISMPRSTEPKVTKSDVVNVDALIQKVSRLNQQKKHQDAIRLLMVALEEEQKDSMLRPLLMQSFDMFLEEQIRLGEQELRINSKDSGAYLRVATSLELLDNDSRAMEILVRGISVVPDAPDLWMEIGKLELKAGRHREAFDVFKEVSKNNPKNSDAFNNAAFVLVKASDSNEKELKEAENLALKARKLDPNNPEYIDTLAEVHFRGGKPDMAQSLMKEAIKLAPDRDFYKNQLKRFSEQQALPVAH